MAVQRLLFAIGDLPDSFDYREAFIDRAEEAALGQDIGRLEFATFELRGVAARRRVAFFGRFNGAGAAPAPAPPIPGFLLPLRARLAAWAELDADAFAMALINEYPPGAPIGWHRDAPQYDIVAGVSLLSSCRMKLRPYVAPGASAGIRRTATHEVTLQRRSAYLLRREARRAYEHQIPPVSALRYSITFRTLWA
jgi:hypothetical protein